MATTPCCHILHHTIIPTKSFTQNPSPLSYLGGTRRRTTTTATRSITTLGSAGPISLLRGRERKTSSALRAELKHEHDSSAQKSPSIQQVQLGNAFDISTSVDFEKFGQSLALGLLSLAVSATTLLAPLVDNVSSADEGKAAAASYPCENTEEYYAGLKDLKGSKLKSELHKLIKGHQVYTYAQVWEALKILDAADDQDPAASPDVNDIYSGKRIAKSLANDSSAPQGWNREHLWPRSYGLAEKLPEFSDLHNLRPSDINVNSARNNKYYGECTPEDGKCMQPANREAGDDTATNTNLWTPPSKVRGDIARAMMYMAVRYEGEQAGSKDLELTDTPNKLEGRMGLLSALLKWHALDPPSAPEKLRNERVCSLYQHNRNPFVDHPEYAALVWTSSTGSVVSGEPDTPSTGPVVSGDPGNSTTGGRGGGQATVPDVTTFALDSSVPAWINEIHYDNKGVDVDEFVEVAVGPGVDPRDLRVVFYNGGNNQAYKTVRLVTGESGPQPSGFQFFSVKADGLQNGPSDGLALVITGGEGRDTPKVIQFLSYEGKLAAQDGPAKGLTSVDIGLEEGDSTPEGSSLGLTGRGSKYADFKWATFLRDSTPGVANKGEVIVSP